MSQVETVFKWNGAEFSFDARDADDAELLQTAYEKMKEDEKNLPKVGASANIIRENCKVIKNYFDNIFGKGAGTAICTEKNNLALCYAPYEAFLKFVSSQKDDILNTKNKFAQYSNRQQRRAAAKQSK